MRSARFRLVARAMLAVALLWLVAGCARPVPAAGLRPLPLQNTFDPIVREMTALQPTLRWETFPRPEDLKVDKEGKLSTARNPTYELRIWRAEQNFPAELVYARSGLAEPVHTIETPLVPDTLYLWTIRALFDLDNQPRVTEWGVMTDIRGSRPVAIPDPGYYRFKTPK